MALREYAKARRFEVFDEYVDVGISGAKETRPALDQLMDGARKRRFDAVLVARFDRFARSTRHLVLALEEFSALGVDFISLSESIDTSTPMGKMIFVVISAVAELERSLIRERVAMGLQRAKAQGKRIGRPAVHLDSVEIEALRDEGLRLQGHCPAVGCQPSDHHVRAQWEVSSGSAVGLELVNLTSGLTQRLLCQSPVVRSAPLGHLAAWFFRWRT